MASLQCISCNSTILDAARLCKCGHVNEAMLTIAGKRFSGYREELYTRRVIKESRDEYRRMKRESRGMKTRLRTSLQNQHAEKLRRNTQVDIPAHRRVTMTTFKPSQTTSDQCSKDNYHVISNTRTASNATNIITATNRTVSHDYNHVTTHDVTMNRRQSQYRKNHHLSRHTTHDHRTTTTKSLLQEQLSMAGPLAEINKRLMNQRVFWMCLADSLVV